MSAVFLNETSLQRQFERQNGVLSGRRSGGALSVGLECQIPASCRPLVDHRTPVYLDQFAHASLWEGARMAGAPAHAFRHNQPAHLERLIKRYGPGLILVDAIYSAYGTICPLAEIAALSERAGCILAVDESHAIGVYGPHGEGLVHTLGLTEKVQYRTFSLSKAFATRAGMVAGPERVMTYFPYEARPAIFSSAVLQHEVAALAATLKVVQEEDWRRQQLLVQHALSARRFAKAWLRGRSNHLADHRAAFGATKIQTRALRDALEDRGIFGAVFAAPATPKNHAIIRLSVNARLRENDLDRVIDTCRTIAQEKEISPWPKGLLKSGPVPGQDDADNEDLRDKEMSIAIASLRNVSRELSGAAKRW